MRATISIVAILACLSVGCVSDQSVRYVYQDKDFGVVGMPENTNRWPTRYRHRAERLMDRHFPDGHEIVRAEEVDAGSRTVKVEGSRTAELGPQLPLELAKVARLGRTASRSQSDVTKIKECRIVYRRRAGSEVSGYSPDIAARPEQYIDPNDETRKKLERPEKDQKASGGDTSDNKKKPDAAGNSESR
ncbi:MAG: hypothetical protein U0790_15715 [Isosphaeraceae bacterium]